MQSIYWLILMFFASIVHFQLSLLGYNFSAFDGPAHSHFTVLNVISTITLLVWTFQVLAFVLMSKYWPICCILLLSRLSAVHGAGVGGISLCPSWSIQRENVFSECMLGCMVRIFAFMQVCITNNQLLQDQRIICFY